MGANTEAAARITDQNEPASKGRWVVALLLIAFVTVALIICTCVPDTPAS
jgi:hypothetical protein